MQTPDFLFGLTPGDLTYDIETYPNCFLIGLQHRVTKQRWQFEISPRTNDLFKFCLFICAMQQQGNRMIGFNNIGFDYPVIHYIYKSAAAYPSAFNIYDKAMSIINAPDHARFSHMVWENDWLVPQIDLYKIHHFDNRAKSTSLKMLEFNMRMGSIEDLPFEVGKPLTNNQIQVLADYMWHDIDATDRFCDESADQIRFREELSTKYDRNFLNHNDTKIGKDYFIMRLEEANPGCCYRVVDGKRKMVQTQRDMIDLAEVIIPCIDFGEPEFQRILNWFKAQVITETKGTFKDISCTVNGFQFDFGTGGIHGSVESQIIRSDDDYVIIDLDVASYYPNLAITNRFYPQHLGETFCNVYEDVYQQRKQYPKGSAENAMLKLALNGVYGDSNNQYSPFYDPQYTMSITINGQLLLCLLAEALMQHQDVQMIQINTDGLTIRCPRDLQQWVSQVATWWEKFTGLTLESVEYQMMAIRDVNNYIGVYTDGKVKRKGAYEYQLGWHQNHSALVVPKAAEAALVHDRDIREFITHHDDIFDFFLRTKVPRSSKLEWGGEQVQNIVRYYISTEGRRLEKMMPPAGPAGAYKKKNGVPDHYYQQVLQEVGDAWDERIHTKNRSIYEERRTGIHTGWTVELCNKLENSIDNLNIDWYVQEASKLVDPLLK